MTIVNTTEFVLSLTYLTALYEIICILIQKTNLMKREKGTQTSSSAQFALSCFCKSSDTVNDETAHGNCKSSVIKYRKNKNCAVRCELITSRNLPIHSFISNWHTRCYYIVTQMVPRRQSNIVVYVQCSPWNIF